MEQLGAIDALFVYGETTRAPSHNTGLAIYDPSTAPEGAMTFEKVRAHIGARLGSDRSLRAVITRVPFDLDRPHWVDDQDFHLSNHVHRIWLPDPGGWDRLREVFSELHARPLDLRRPPWEYYFIENLGDIPDVPPGAFALCFKQHHAAADGVTVRGLTTRVHDPTPDGPSEPEEEAWTPAPPPSRWELLGRTALATARRPPKVVTTAVRVGPALARMVLPDLSGDSDSDSPQLEAPRTRLNVAIDGRRNFDGRSYDLEMIKAARGLVSGATVNDVVVAGIGGALRRYLLGLDDLPEDSLVGLMPISLHADPKMEGGNRITIARVPLGTHIEDPAERLGEVHEATSRSKEVSQGAGAGSLVEFSELLPGALVTMAVRVSQSLNLVERVPVVGGNTLVSNIPGPRKPIYFAGARMVSEYGVPPILDGGTLANVITSYCGRVFVSLGSSPKVMPDIEHYGDCVDQSFAEYTGRSKKSQNRRTASRA